MTDIVTDRIGLRHRCRSGQRASFCQTPSWLEKFNQEIPDKVSAINLGKWDPVVLNAYGIRSVPSCWLIDAEGRVELTGQDVLSALGSGETTLSDLIQQAISQD